MLPREAARIIRQSLLDAGQRQGSLPRCCPRTCEPRARLLLLLALLLVLSHHLLQFGQLREVQLEPQVQQQGQLLRQEPACPLLPQAAPAAVHSPCPDQVQDFAAGADQAVLHLHRLLLLRQHLRLQPEVMQLLLQVLYVVLRVLSGLHSACGLPVEGTVKSRTAETAAAAGGLGLKTGTAAVGADTLNIQS